MPAQSPTLSPTLSAITAGLRGSSSGMPASILPTMSAPTSAPLVKMPPPRRAKTEISEPPKPRPIERVHGVLGVDVEDPGEDAVVAGDAEQREADDEHAGHRAAAEGDVERRADAAAGRLGHARVGAHGHVHADEAGRRGGKTTDREADRDLDVLQRDQRDEQDDADDADRRVLAPQVRLRALLNGSGEPLHHLVARRQREQLARRDARRTRRRARRRSRRRARRDRSGNRTRKPLWTQTKRNGSPGGPPCERRGVYRAATDPGTQRRPDAAPDPGSPGFGGFGLGGSAGRRRPARRAARRPSAGATARP